MTKNFYILSDGALSSEQNVFRFDSKDKMTRLAVETVSSIHLYGGISVTSGALKLSGKHNIPLHVFGYYGNYMGTYWPKEAYFSGDLTIKQALLFSDNERRIEISVQLLRGIYRNMRYLLRKFGADISTFELVLDSTSIPSLMLSEARMRKAYYSILDSVIKEPFKIETRDKRPPSNYGNSLVSFLNSLLYSEFVTQARLTSVNITIPFYHSPESGRFALSLDLSEIFKPGLVDRLILSLINQGLLQGNTNHFHEVGNGILLNERGRKIVLESWEAWLESSSFNEKLKRKVSHRELIRMEIHKYVKFVEGIEPYRPIQLPAD